MTQNQSNDHNLDKIFTLAESQMDQDIRSELLDEKVRLAIERGFQNEGAYRGSGYLSFEEGAPDSGEENGVAYEFVVLSNPKLNRGYALGSMVGNESVLARAMGSGRCRLHYAAEKGPIGIRIVRVEGNRADFECSAVKSGNS
jgi:hypothetical protein